MTAHVDVRGPWPVYVSGYTGVELRGQPREISVDSARVLAERVLAAKITLAS